MLLGSPILAVLLATGCGSREPIQSYDVPKEKVAEPPAVASAEPAETAEPAEVGEPAVDPAEVGEPTHRMLAAILPVGNRAWFFKVVGPVAAVEKRAEEIDKFFAGIRPGENGRPTWELPAQDWKEEQGGGMRAATIWIPTDGDPLELTVIPAMGDVLSNVNRWRGQMKLPPASQQQLAELTREIEAGDATITIVDLRGQFDAGSAMMPPFARGARGQAGQAPELPPGHPPIDAPQLPPGHPPIDDINIQKDSGAPDGDR